MIDVDTYDGCVFKHLYNIYINIIYNIKIIKYNCGMTMPPNNISCVVLWF